MRRLFRTLRLLNLLAEQRELLAVYADIVKRQQAASDAQALQHFKEIRAMAVAWRTHLEMPEVEMRDDLTRMIRDLDGNIAVLEEMIV